MGRRHTRVVGLTGALAGAGLAGVFVAQSTEVNGVLQSWRGACLLTSETIMEGNCRMFNHGLVTITYGRVHRAAASL